MTAIDPRDLERAFDAVRADMRATGLTGEIRLVRPGWAPGNAAVETWAGDQGWTGLLAGSPVLWLLLGGPARGSTGGPIEGPVGGTGGSWAVFILILSFGWAHHRDFRPLGFDERRAEAAFGS